MNLSPRMSLLAVFCLLLFAFLGAAGTTVNIATPMTAPEWARLEPAFCLAYDAACCNRSGLFG